MISTATNITRYPTTKVGRGCFVCASVAGIQAKDLETIESGWAMSGRRPTPHPDTAA